MMFDFNNYGSNKKVNCDEDRKENMKDYLDYDPTMDSTKKEHPSIEPKTASNKEENQNNDSNKPKSQSNINTIEPNFNHINLNSSQENTPTKTNKKSKNSNKPKIDEKIGTFNNFDFHDFYKLRSHFFRMQQILEPLNIKIIESNLINLKQTIEKIGKGIKIFEQMIKNEKSLSEAFIILENYQYLIERKNNIETIINAYQNINFDKEENFLNLNFEENQKSNIDNDKSNSLNNEMKSSNTSNQGATKENDNEFLNKKRYLKRGQLNNINNITDNNNVNNIDIDNDNNIINSNIKEPGPSTPINNGPGRLSNESIKKGIKGKKDGSHPDNGVIKIMRHSLENICSILKTIVDKIDKNIKIFFPGINDKDLKNTTKKEEYLKKTIEDILCVYISIETKKDEFEENRKKFNQLLGKDIRGKEKEKNLLKQILQMTLGDVCNNFINNIKKFIDEYTFKTFEDDEDFQKYDNSKREKILEKFKDLMGGKIIKRNKIPKQ